MNQKKKKMENIDNIILTPKVVNHIMTIFGWVWLIVFYIFRYKYLPRAFFLFLIIAFFSQLTIKVQELIINDFILERSLWGYQIVNWFWIFAFFYYLKFRVYNEDKRNCI